MSSSQEQKIEELTDSLKQVSDTFTNGAEQVKSSLDKLSEMASDADKDKVEKFKSGALSALQKAQNGDITGANAILEKMGFNYGR